LLAGLPIGVKDIIDTADICRPNTVPDLSRQPPFADGRLHRQLRQAGAVIMGKTVTDRVRQPYPAIRQPAQTRAYARRFFERFGRWVADFQITGGTRTQTGGR